MALNVDVIVPFIESLLGVQFVKDGERLAGGGVAAADDFEALPEADARKIAEWIAKGASK